jgi:hypothetical protein
MERSSAPRTFNRASAGYPASRHVDDNVQTVAALRQASEQNVAPVTRPRSAIAWTRKPS